MKVIGTQGGYNESYICIIEHSEIEKYLNLYYRKLPQLKVGETVDLGRGYDHAREIADAMDKTREFVKANQAVVTAIMQGMSIESLARAADAQASTSSTSA